MGQFTIKLKDAPYNSQRVKELGDKYKKVEIRYKEGLIDAADMVEEMTDLCDTPAELFILSQIALRLTLPAPINEAIKEYMESSDAYSK